MFLCSPFISLLFVLISRAYSYVLISSAFYFSHFQGIFLCSPFISLLFVLISRANSYVLLLSAPYFSHFQGIFLCSPFISLVFFSFPGHIPMFFHQPPIFLISGAYSYVLLSSGSYFSHFQGIFLCSPFISLLFFSLPGHIPMFSFHQAHLCSNFQVIFLCSPFISLLFFSFPGHIPMFSFHQALICSHFQGIILCFLLSSASYFSHFQGIFLCSPFISLLFFSFPGHIPMFSFHQAPIFSFPGHIPMFSFHQPPIFLTSRAYSYVLLSSASYLFSFPGIFLCSPFISLLFFSFPGHIPIFSFHRPPIFLTSREYSYVLPSSASYLFSFPGIFLCSPFISLLFFSLPGHIPMFSFHQPPIFLTSRAYSYVLPSSASYLFSFPGIFLCSPFISLLFFLFSEHISMFSSLVHIPTFSYFSGNFFHNLLSK